MLQFIILMGGVYLADVVTKWAVRAWIPLYSEIKVLSVFSLVHVENTGIAFGLFQDRNLFFLISGLVIVGLIVTTGIRMLASDRFSALVLAVVSGGALGNLTDRLLHGRVTDFLDFYIGAHHWPAFNVADSAICVGAALLLIRSFKTSSRT